MNLKLKFNIALILAFVLGLIGTAWLADSLFKRHAREEVLQTAQLMLQSAQAVRHYTVSEIRPLLSQLESKEFIPQTVPAYAASRFVSYLRKALPDYSYKEAVLNPTNPNDRAVDWETDIIAYFRAHPDASQLVTERNTVTGPMLYLSKPIRITNPSCLACHDTPAKAPKPVIARYGDQNGFGWKLNQVVGAQIVAVPQSVSLKRAHVGFVTFIAALVSVFLALGIVTNVMLHYLVTRPVKRMARHADEVSMGTLDLPELPDKGKDEISILARAFNRMQRSLKNAFEMMNG